VPQPTDAQLSAHQKRKKSGMYVKFNITSLAIYAHQNIKKRNKKDKQKKGMNTARKTGRRKNE
jgi:hypothetical protein